jgi:hypothetical protein
MTKVQILDELFPLDDPRAWLPEDRVGQFLDTFDTLKQQFAVSKSHTDDHQALQQQFDNQLKDLKESLLNSRKDWTIALPSARRPRRRNLQKQSTSVLKQWLRDHINHPYPTAEDLQTLADITRLTASQVNNWMI